MGNDQSPKDKFDIETKYVADLRSNKVDLPNLFTVEMGKLIKSAREEMGYSQTALAKIINRRQAMISEIEAGKIDLDVQTLVLLSLELKKPISYFLPDMYFLIRLVDIENKFEEEVLHLVREIEYEGDTSLIIPFLKMLTDYYEKMRKPFGDDLESP